MARVRYLYTNWTSLIIGNNPNNLKIGKDLNNLFLSLNSLLSWSQYSHNSLKSTNKYLKQINSLKTLKLLSAQCPIIIVRLIPNLSNLKKLSIPLVQQVLQLGSPQPLWPLMKILAKHCRPTAGHLHPQPRVLCLLSHKSLAKHCRWPQPKKKKQRLSQFHGDGWEQHCQIKLFIKGKAKYISWFSA